MPLETSSMPEGPASRLDRLHAGLAFHAVAVATLILYLRLLLALARGSLSPSLALLLHVSVSATLGMGAVTVHRRGADSRLPLLLAITTAGTGPFGAAGCLLISALNVWYARIATPFQDWYASLFPEQTESLSERVYDRVKDQLNGDASGEAASFADVIRFGTLEEKQAVLAVLSKRFKPAFAPILKLALQDEVNAVRVQAATAVSIIESEFAERIRELTELRDRGAAPEAHLRLACLYDDYAFTGLLDADRERVHRARALEAYERYLEARPGVLEVELKVGRLLLRDGRFVEAAGWLERGVRGERPPVQSAVWYMECLFHLRRFAELRRLARRCRAAPAAPLSRPAIEAIALWAGATA